MSSSEETGTTPAVVPAVVPAEEVVVVTESDARIRRAPKYSVFLVVGGALGAIGTLVATSLFPVDPQVGFAALVGYFALYGVTGGVLLGALVALIIDRVTLRRARPATIRLTTVGNPGDIVQSSAAARSSGGDPVGSVPVDAVPVDAVAVDVDDAAADPADGATPADQPRE